jgi:hypothetical protein
VSFRARAIHRRSTVLAVLLSGLAGCPRAGGDARHGGEHDGVAVHPLEVSDADFAGAVHRLLREGAATPERAALLAGAVRRQLAHAAEHFGRGDDECGAQAVLGALYLLRLGEAQGAMFQAEGIPALAGAVRRFSARGDEGRVLALLRIQQELFREGSRERAEIDERRAALERWMTETRHGAEMLRLGAEERAAVARALLEPSEEALAAASDAVRRWIDRAIAYHEAFQQTQQRPSREEALEAFRALQAGGRTMAAIFLRHGRARQALASIEQSSARRVVSPSFFAKLRAAAVDDTAEDWRVLARDFARAAFDEEGEEQRMEADLVGGAMWGAAIEAYRRDPTSLAIGHILAGELVRMGMPEVAPVVLRDALGPTPSVPALSGALAAIGQTIASLHEAGSPEPARRAFVAGSPLLALADAPAYRGRVSPSAAELRQLMASIELRAGSVQAARPLLLAALDAEPSVWGFTHLATLERQGGDTAAALGLVRRGLALPEARTAPLEAGEAELLMFELSRDRNETKLAEEALGRALERALAARAAPGAGRAQARGPEDLVRAEMLLARVLDGYGERAAAGRAVERALDFAGRHRAVAETVMLGVVARGLAQRDLTSSRAALRLGIKDEVEQSGLVYGALWLMLLEKTLSKAPDGTAERVLVEAVHGDGWTGRLARWARGLLGDGELRSAARTPAERTEADFYVAMRARAGGRADGDALLATVAESPLVDLLEVRIARDLRTSPFAAKIPPGIALP